jgi:hypothetical protein
VAVLSALSSVTYYLVEAPMQRAGHGLTRRLDTRFGPDRLAPAGARSCDRGPAGGPLRRDDDT